MQTNNLKPQLFLLHFAGGNVYSFNFLKKYLDSTFELVSIELPGRGKRMGETLITDKKNAVKDIYNELQKRITKDVPFFIYGHSMGAILGFELIQLLEKNNVIPQCFIASGNPGPGLLPPNIRYNLDRENFIAELKKLGGIANEVFENDELFDFFEPILRADFEIVERQTENSLDKINCPIYCVMGNLEKRVENISNWEKYTNLSFTSEVFEGNHFFINNQAEKLAHFIKKAYNGSLVF